jgi:ATP-dependent protease ClpP protease subunit
MVSLLQIQLTMKYDIDIDSYIGYPISKQWVKSKLDTCKKKPCNVRINSYGGDVQHALDIRQQFVDNGEVIAYIYGMTASAATILAMGAKTIKMSRHALMLVHKCSTVVFQWEMMNEEQLESYIKDLTKQKEDNQTIDGVIANIYANRCKKNVTDMLDVMSKGAWLNAEECKQLGIVDDIIEDDEKPAKLTNEMKEHFVACGLPIPTEDDSSPLDVPKSQEVIETNTLLQALRALFSPKRKEDVKPNNEQTMIKNFLEVNKILNVEGLEDKENKVTLDTAQLQAIEDNVKGLLAKIEKLTTDKTALETSNAQLNTQIENLKKAPGAETTKVVDNATGEVSDIEAAKNCQEFANQFKNII